MFVHFSLEFKCVNPRLPLVSRALKMFYCYCKVQFYSEGKWCTIWWKLQCNLMAVNGQRIRLHVTLCPDPFWIMHSSQVSSGYPVSFIHLVLEDRSIMNIFLTYSSFFFFFRASTKIFWGCFKKMHKFMENTSYIVWFILCYRKMIMCTRVCLLRCWKSDIHATRIPKCAFL